MIKFRTYSQRKKQGREISGFYLYSLDELLEDIEGKGYLEVYGGFSVWNLKGHGLVVEKSQFNNGIGKGCLSYDEIKGNPESFFNINDSPNAFRLAWFKTREGAKRFLNIYGKENLEGECLGLWAPSIMIFNE
jgi:hypothetical protein